MSEQQTPTEKTEETKTPDVFHYFLVAGEIHFLDSKFNKSPKTLKVNAVYQGSGVGLIARDLAKIQTRLQMAFHQKYSRTHSEAPNVTDCVILGCSYIGTHTSEEFLAGAPGTEKTSEPAKQTPTAETPQ